MLDLFTGQKIEANNGAKKRSPEEVEKNIGFSVTKTGMVTVFFGTNYMEKACWFQGKRLLVNRIEAEYDPKERRIFIRPVKSRERGRALSMSWADH